MYISQHMKLDPVTVGPETSIAMAKELLESKHFRHLPVVDEQGCLMGMATDRDIRSAYPSTVAALNNLDTELEKINQTPVSEIMSCDVINLMDSSTLDDALLLFDRQKVGALPVLDEKRKVIGMFSIRDLIFAYKGLFGLGEKGSSLVAVKADGRPRPLSRVVHVLEDNDIHFSRIVRKKADEQRLHKDIIYIRVNTFNIHAVHHALQEAGFEIDHLYQTAT